MKNSDVTGGDRKNVKNTFDTLLQVGRDFVKFVSLNRIKEINVLAIIKGVYTNQSSVALHVCFTSFS